MSTATLFGIHLTGAPLLLALLVLVLAILVPLFRSPGPELAGPEVVENLEDDEGLDDLDVSLTTGMSPRVAGASNPTTKRTPHRWTPSPTC
jgi:hypothetical protein